MPAKSVLPVKINPELLKGAKVKAFNTQDEASLELKNGGADAVIGDARVVEYYMTKAGKDFAKTVGERMEAEPYGIAVKKAASWLAI